MKTTTSSYLLRPRGALELFDASLRLYKAYFWQLLGVSALVWVGTGLGYFFLLSIISLVNSSGYGENAAVVSPLSAVVFFLLVPFLYGAIGCCLEAAIDGRDVSFRECIKYTRIRYMALLKSQFFAVAMAIILGLILGIIFIALLLFASQGTSPDILAPLLSFIVIVLYICCSLYFFGALTLMPLLICLEYHSRHIIKPTERSHQLSWSRAKSLIILVFTHALGLLFLSIVLTGFTEVMVDFILLQDFMRGFSSDASSFFLLIGALFSSTVIAMFWSPFYLMTLGTFYVDVRIRKEAFDLECALAGRGKMEQTS